jgi:hypothetical protein
MAAFLVPGSGARSNIMSAELITELTAAFDDLEQREDVSARGRRRWAASPS